MNIKIKMSCSNGNLANETALNRAIHALEIVYGDTDSLFLHYKNSSTDSFLNEEIVSKFKEGCSKQLGVEVEHTKTYRTALISDKKSTMLVGLAYREKNKDEIVRIRTAAVGKKNNENVRVFDMCKARGYPHEAIPQILGYQRIYYISDKPHKHRAKAANRRPLFSSL